MTQTIRLQPGTSRYDVVVGDGLVASLPELPLSQSGRLVIIADRGVIGLHGESLLGALRDQGHSDAPVLEIDPGEQSKSWEWLQKGCQFLAEKKLGRNDWVICLGGGVVCDLAGFIASVYLRGVRYVSIPTTLLAQVDASVGGKTAINIAAGKNLVGTFHQPSLVIADVATLKTLPGREFKAGMAEVVKHGLIDRSLYAMVRKNLAGLTRGADADPKLLVDLVAANVRCKAAIVAEDEREGGVRAHLNLGHTFAHAIEATLGFGKLLHGEAVAIGLVAACNLSAHLGMTAGDLQKEVEEILDTLGLPTRLPPCNIEDLLGPMAHDKKNIHGKMRLVMVSAPGEVFIEEDVPIDAILGTLKELKADDA